MKNTACWMFLLIAMFVFTDNLVFASPEKVKLVDLNVQIDCAKFSKKYSKSDFLRSFRFVPYFKNGVEIGKRLFALKEDSFLRIIGFESGDVIREVNGKMLGDTSFDVFEALSSQGSLIVKFIRNNVENRRVISFSAKPLCFEKEDGQNSTTKKLPFTTDNIVELLMDMKAIYYNDKSEIDILLKLYRAHSSAILRVGRSYTADDFSIRIKEGSEEEFVAMVKNDNLICKAKKYSSSYDLSLCQPEGRDIWGADSLKKSPFQKEQESSNESGVSRLQASSIKELVSVLQEALPNKIFHEASIKEKSNISNFITYDGAQASGTVLFDEKPVKALGMRVNIEFKFNYKDYKHFHEDFKKFITILEKKKIAEISGFDLFLDERKRFESTYDLTFFTSEEKLDRDFGNHNIIK